MKEEGGKVRVLGLKIGGELIFLICGRCPEGIALGYGRQWAAFC